jgi:hypothetical protein
MSMKPVAFDLGHLGWHDHMGCALLCPSCEGNNLHLCEGRVAIDGQGDDGASLDFWCEGCGGNDDVPLCTLSFTNHKGTVYTTFEVDDDVLLAMKMADRIDPYQKHPDTFGQLYARIQAAVAEAYRDKGTDQ